MLNHWNILCSSIDSDCFFTLLFNEIRIIVEESLSIIIFLWLEIDEFKLEYLCFDLSFYLLKTMKTQMNMIKHWLKKCLTWWSVKTKFEFHISLVWKFRRKFLTQVLWSSIRNILLKRSMSCVIHNDEIVDSQNHQWMYFNFRTRLFSFQLSTLDLLLFILTYHETDFSMIFVRCWLSSDQNNKLRKTKRNIELKCDTGESIVQDFLDLKEDWISWFYLQLLF